MDLRPKVKSCTFTDMSEIAHQAGFVAILGKPNAGKSTLLNALLQDKLAIVSPKVQTTRHRIMGILTEPQFQIIFSDTPGIIEPEYGMHQRMMSQVQASLKDADVAIYLVDASGKIDEQMAMLQNMKLKMPILLVLNKIDKISAEQLQQRITHWRTRKDILDIMPISALQKLNIDELLAKIVSLMPQHPPYFEGDDISNRPLKFFVSEMIREQLYKHLDEELPYHAAVLVEQYQEKTTLVKIVASIIVSRESQKAIILGHQGAMIKKLGSAARQDIEAFIDNKVFLELHVKVRANWRDKENFLNEYGY
jgi:GTPase